MDLIFAFAKNFIIEVNNFYQFIYFMGKIIAIIIIIITNYFKNFLMLNLINYLLNFKNLREHLFYFLIFMNIIIIQVAITKN